MADTPQTKPRKLTLQQQRLMAAIPKSTTMQEAGQKAHYSKISGQIYRPHIKAHIKDTIGYNPAKTIQELENLLEKVKNSGDMRLLLDTIDRFCKIHGLFKENNINIQNNLLLSLDDKKYLDEYDKLDI